MRKNNRTKLQSYDATGRRFFVRFQKAEVETMNKQTYLMWRMGRVSHNWVGKNGTNLHNFWVRNIGLFPLLCQDKPLTYLYSEIWVSIPQHPFSEILLFTLFLREIAIYISVGGGNRKKIEKQGGGVSVTSWRQKGLVFRNNTITDEFFVLLFL